jgi:hypothetical protein
VLIAKPDLAERRSAVRPEIIPDQPYGGFNKGRLDPTGLLTRGRATARRRSSSPWTGLPRRLLRGVKDEIMFPKPSHCGLAWKRARDRLAEIDKRIRKLGVEEVRKLFRDLSYEPLTPDWRSGYSRPGEIQRELPFAATHGTWDDDSRMLLVREVSLLTRIGLTEREALRQLAGNPEKLALFPYREQYKHSERNNSRAAEALRQQLQQIKNDKSIDEHVRHELRRHLAGEFVSSTFERAAAEAEHRRKILVGEI